MKELTDIELEVLRRDCEEFGIEFHPDSIIPVLQAIGRHKAARAVVRLAAIVNSSGQPQLQEHYRALVVHLAKNRRLREIINTETILQAALQFGQPFLAPASSCASARR